MTQSIANINAQSAKMTNLSAKMANWDPKIAPSWDKKWSFSKEGCSFSHFDDFNLLI